MCETVSGTGISNANTLGLSGPFSMATIAARHARAPSAFQSLLVSSIHSAIDQARSCDDWKFKHRVHRVHNPDLRFCSNRLTFLLGIFGVRKCFQSISLALIIRRMEFIYLHCSKFDREIKRCAKKGKGIRIFRFIFNAVEYRESLVTSQEKLARVLALSCR